MKAALIARDLSYGAPGGSPLHRPIHLELKAGHLLHITGSNGSGKSLLARTLAGINPVLAGTVENTFSGQRYLTQTQGRFTHLPYSLREVLFLNGNLPGHWKELGLLTERKLDLGWNQASGGERQRCLLTRFFLQAGELLVLDEPFNHLDRDAIERCRELLRETMIANPRCGTLLISHDDTPQTWMRDIPVQTLHLGWEESER